MPNIDFDLLIIGGGIVGAGIARDAALRGIKTLLVEQSDFASGTSSRSSRLLHGGIRYLAQGKIPLVFEAGHEKSILFQIAPHLAEPLPFLFPTYKKTAWPKWKMALGVRIYDVLCGKNNKGKSSTLSKENLKTLLPKLDFTQSTGGVRYFDGLTNDSRLVIDTLSSASRNGAEIHNYTQFLDAEKKDTNWICELKELSSGKKRTISCRGIINATGVWSPTIKQSNVSLCPTKGVHLVIDRTRLSTPSAVVLTEKDRILFLIPWGDRTILGTTDTIYSGDLDHPTCDASDLKYILNQINKYFPSIKLQSTDVLSSWAGLRPLIADSHGNPSDISRKHEITMPQAGWWDVTGGKLTTYRLIAEQTIDSFVKKMKISTPDCSTAKIPLISGRPKETTYSGCYPPKVTREIVEYYVTNEWVSHLDDLMCRRTSWCHYLKDPLNIAKSVASWMSELMNWSEEKKEKEILRYTTLHNQQHNIT